MKSSGKSVVDNLITPLGNAEAIYKGATQLLSGEYTPIDTNNPIYSYANERDTIRSTNAQAIKDSTGSKVLSTLYSSGMSVIDNAVLNGIEAATGMKGLSLATMGANSAADTTKSTFERTGSTSKALATGAAAGAIEVGTEMVSLDKVWGLVRKNQLSHAKNAFVDALLDTVVQGSIEGSEESISTVLNAVADNVINGAQSEYQQNIAKYKADGMTQEEAEKKAINDVASEVAQSFAGGALAGLMSGALYTGVGKVSGKVQTAVSNTKQLNAIVNERISAQEQQTGKKLTTAEKTAIRNQVKAELNGTATATQNQTAAATENIAPATSQRGSAAQGVESTVEIPQGSTRTRQQTTAQSEDIAPVKATTEVPNYSEYVSNRASDLLQEFKSMQKGKTVSDSLSEILSQRSNGTTNSEIRQALNDIKNNTENSSNSTESFIRDLIKSEYEESYGNVPTEAATKAATVAEDLAPVMDEVENSGLGATPATANTNTQTATATASTEADIAPVKATTETAGTADTTETATAETEETPSYTQYVTNRANALLTELNSMQKGKRVSNALSEILDLRDNEITYSDIRQALANVRGRADGVVNSSDHTETFIRDLLKTEYDGKYNSGVTEADRTSTTSKSVSKMIDAEINELNTKISDAQARIKNVSEQYDAEIAKLRTELDGKKRKETKVAQNLQRRIDDLTARRNKQIEQENARITRYEASLEKKQDPKYSRARQKTAKMTEYFDWADELLGDTSTWKDKKIGLQYQTSTQRRNLMDIVRDSDGNRDFAKATEIDDATMGVYTAHEAQATREINAIFDKFRDLKINSKENKYIQMLGELRENPAATITEEEATAYKEKYASKIDDEKVETALSMARELYDNLYERVNTVLKEQGFAEIEHHEGYFPHFVKEASFLEKIFNWRIQNNEIPTDIAGLTEDFNPQRTWQSFNKKRRGEQTEYNFLGGIDAYTRGAMDWIYHIEDLQKRRAIENVIRYEHSESGVKDQVEKIMKDESLDADEAQERINQVFVTAKNPLGGFLQDFRTQTNILAGKKSTLDRSVETALNRHIYSTMTNISGRTSANMIAGNIHSALTNFIPIFQATGVVNPVYFGKAAVDIGKNAVHDDGMINKSDFLTNRLNSVESLDELPIQKASKYAGILMEDIDNFTSQMVWRGMYNQSIDNGMTEAEAIKHSDQFASDLMASRSKGAMPTIFSSKNPLIKSFTAFQLEVANQYEYMFKDMPRTYSEKGAVQLAKNYFLMFAAAHLYNIIFDSDSALDPIKIAQEFLKAAGLAPDDDDDEDTEREVNIEAGLSSLWDNINDNLPFASILGGGRIPLSSALPYGSLSNMTSYMPDDIKDIANGTDEEKKDAWKSLADGMSYPAFYFLMPFAGGQLKKTLKGLEMYTTDEKVKGSYTSDGRLRFPVDTDAGSVVKSLMMGQWANDNAEDYLTYGRSALTENQTKEFGELGISIQKYWNILDNLKDKSTAEEQTEYIAGLHLTDEQKNILINNRRSSDTDIDISNYDDYGSYDEFNFAIKNEEKYQYLQDNNISYGTYTANKDEYDWRYKNQEKSKWLDDNDISYEDYSASDDSKTAYNWAYQNPEAAKLGDLVNDDVVTYRSYTKAIGNITADKNANGKSISGSRKKKVQAYIEGLSLSKIQKEILYTSIYTSDDSYKKDILQYVNNQKDMTYDDRVDVLEELGFSLTSSGKVSW